MCRRVVLVLKLVVAPPTVVSGGNADFLAGLEPSLNREMLVLVSLIPMLLLSRLTSVRVLSVVMRVSRPAVRPIVLPVALPTVPRVAAFGSRTLVVLLAPIVLPIRDVDNASDERWLVAACFFTDIDGSLLPIILPIPRPRSVRSVERLVLTLDGVEGLVELTAGCLAPVGAEELLVPIVLPIRERWLVVGCFFAFEAGGVLRLLEPPIREAPLERAAGCVALLGTDGLVVLIVLPIRDVMLGLILLLVLVVDLFVIVFRDLSTGRLTVLLGWLLVLLEEIERLLEGVFVLIVLPIRDVMLELMRPLELLRLLERGVDVRELIDLLEVLLLGLGADVRELIDLLGVLLLELRFVIALLEVLLLGARLVMALLEVLRLGALLVITLLEVLRLGALLVMALLDVLLLGARLVITLLEVLLLGALLVMARLDELLLGARLVIDRLELLLLLGALLVTLLLELRLDETLLERLDVGLDEDLVTEDDLEDDRLELLDLLLLDRLFAAITGSQNNKSANRVQKTSKSEPSRRDSKILIFDL